MTPSNRVKVGRGYGEAALGVALLTLLIGVVPGAQRVENISVLYLLVVIGTALRHGSRPAIAGSFLAFFAFNWFFVPPTHTLLVADPAEWISLLMLLVTGATTGHLTASLQDRVEEARRRERETAALAEASWAIASQVDPQAAVREVLRRIAEVVPTRRLLLTSDLDGFDAVEWPVGAHPGRQIAPALRERIYHARKPVAWSPDAAASDVEAPSGAAYLPLLVDQRVVGILELEVDAPSPQERRVVESLANHAAVILERQRLAHAETQAQALRDADRLKTALLSMVTHDFRSPLTGIKAGVTSLLEEGAPLQPEILREVLVGVDGETDRLNRMVGNLLSLSRLQADAWRPQREPASPWELVELAMGGFSPESRDRVAVTVQPGLESLCVDPVQTGQALRNLVENALKYSPEREKLELTLAREADDALLRVSDRGPGLPAGDEERIFEPFYRAPAQRESSAPGTGLGLALSRGLVEAHGGTLRAYNREGGGAVFEIRLPLSAADGTG